MKKSSCQALKFERAARCRVRFIDGNSKGRHSSQCRTELSMETPDVFAREKEGEGG